MRLSISAFALLFAVSVGSAQTITPAAPTPYTDAQAAAAAPVQSVNTQTGNPVIPTICRQSTPPGSPASVSSTDGTASFTWPNTACSFATMPSCYVSVASSNTLYVFASPIQTTLDATHVVFTVQAALKLLSISLGALTVWGPPPSGTTMNITCVAPPA